MSSEATGLRIAAVISSLRPGGAERVLADLSGGLNRLGHEMTIVTFAPKDEVPFYPLPGDARLLQLGVLGPKSARLPPVAMLKACRALRSTLKRLQPDIVLGFATVGYMVALMATAGLGLKVIAAERADPAAHRRTIGRLRGNLRDLLLRRADHVTVQTTRARKALSFIPDDRISVIANPVPPAKDLARTWIPGPDGRFVLVAVGRLDPVKGYDLLIPAFSRIAGRFPDWDLAIYGEGPARGALQTAIDKAGMSGCIHLKGLTREVGKALAASHAMALPSRFEGFPNALTEAMAAGLPAVVFEGVADDLIANGQTGLRADPADPVASLASALEMLMGDTHVRARLGDDARARVAAFTPKRHNASWDELLRRVAGNA